MVRQNQSHGVYFITYPRKAAILRVIIVISRVLHYKIMEIFSTTILTVDTANNDWTIIESRIYEFMLVKVVIVVYGYVLRLEMINVHILYSFLAVSSLSKRT